jgi:phospholipase/lecithinase/hemolysin
VSPYYQGHFSNGLTWVEDLSNMLGLGTLKPSLAGGNDFAFGGAETGPTAIEGVNPGDLLFQVAQYVVLHPKPVGGALYTLDIGGNDIFKALDELHAGQISPSVAGTAIAQAEANTVHAVETLFALGARNFLFYEVPDLGLAPISAPKDRPGKISPALLRSRLIRRCSPTSSRSSTWVSRSTTCPPMLTSIWSPANLPTSPPNTASASQM